MSMDIYVYEITCSKSYKSYIGVSWNVYHRYKSHLLYTEGILGRAFNKYGRNNFDCKIISIHNSYEEAYKAEIKAIKNKGFPHNVWNISPGGLGGNKIACRKMEGIDTRNSDNWVIYLRINYNPKTTKLQQDKFNLYENEIFIKDYIEKGGLFKDIRHDFLSGFIDIQTENGFVKSPKKKLIPTKLATKLAKEFIHQLLLERRLSRKQIQKITGFSLGTIDYIKRYGL